MQRQPPLVKVLPRQPGTKESRYVHLLSGDVTTPDMPQPAVSAIHHGDNDRITRLEDEVSGLRREVAELKQQLEGFRKQFD